MGIGLLFLLMVAMPGPVHAESPVVIGVATSLTTLEGRDSLLAARLAVEEINQGGGVAIGNRRVRLKIEAVDLKDAQTDVTVEDAVARLESFLTTSRAMAVVAGPFRSEVLLPAMDVIARRQIPMISTIAMTPAMESKIMHQPDRYRTIFRTGLNTRYLADGLIAAMRFLNLQYGFRRVFIISQDAAWARSTVSLMLKLYFKPTGWQILATRHYPYATDDFSAALAEAARKDAQVILSIFDTPHSGQLVVQWKARQSPGLLCGFISPMMGPGAWKRFNGRIGGVLNMIFELGNIPSQTVARASRFYEAFNTRYHREIEAGHGPAPTYESIYLLAQAITATGSLDAKRVAAALENADRMGAMGRLRFNIGHQVIFGTDPEEAAVACLIQWNERGQRVIVYPPSLAEGDILLPPSASP